LASLGKTSVGIGGESDECILHPENPVDPVDPVNNLFGFAA
jgi:hypothetical protein